MNFKNYLLEKGLISNSISLQLYGYYEIAKLHKILKSNNIFYYVAFGTLLGLIRDGAFINNDSDIDICLYFEDIENLKKLLIKSDYIFVAEIYINNKLKGVKFLTPTNCKLDIFVIYKVGSDIEGISFLLIDWHKGWEDKSANYMYLKYDENYLKEGIEELTLSDKLSFNIPKNYKQHFINYYGENYNIPDSNFYKSGNYLKIPGIKEIKQKNCSHYFKWNKNNTDIITLNYYLDIDTKKLSYGFFNDKNIKYDLSYMEKIYEAQNAFLKIKIQEETNHLYSEVNILKEQNHELKHHIDDLRKHINKIYDKLIFRRIRLFTKNIFSKKKNTNN